MIKKLFSTVLISLLCGGILFSSSVIADINYQINELIDEKSVNFTINTTPSSDIKVTITAPTQEQTVTSSSTVFSREWQVSQPNSLWQALSEYIITWYDRKLYKWNNTDTDPIISSWNVSTTDTTYSMNYNWLTNWKYTLEVDMNFCKWNANTQCSATKDKSFFYVQLSTGDANVFITKPTTDQIVTSKTQEFTRSWNAWSNYQLSWYIYLLTQDWATITGWHTKTNTSITLDELEHWKKYTFTVDMYAKEDNMKVASDTKRFSVDLKNNTYLTITSPTGTGITSKTWTFSRNGDADTNFYYHYTLTSDKWYNYSWDSTKKSDSFNLSDLVSGKYTFNVEMLSSAWAFITWATRIFDVKIPQTLTITNPSSGASLSSSSTTFNWTVYNDTITNPVYSYTLSWPTTYSWTTAATSFNYSNLKNWNYTLDVKMLSWNNTVVAKDSVSFTVSIKSSWWWSWGGGWGSSWKSHKTNEIQLSTDTPNPSKNQWVNLTIKTNDYTWKLTFSAKYRPDTSSSRTDISNNTSSNYYWNYSNIWEEWYYTMKSSDDGEKKLKNLVEFQKEWYYRIYVTDDQWTTSYTEFHIWNTDEERYIARSCKKYKLTYNNSLSVRTSPNLNKNEYFVNTDYFKRYIDSKNAQIQGCPTNDPRISNTYQDTTNRDDKYTAPNGKVYFINNKNWKYQSDELDYPSKLFNTLSEIKYYIRDRNPFIGMAWTK